MTDRDQIYRAYSYGQITWPEAAKLLWETIPSIEKTQHEIHEQTNN